MTPDERLNALLGRVLPDPCPDCVATRRSSDLGSGIVEVVVEHDPTCPRYRAMGGDGR